MKCNNCGHEMTLQSYKVTAGYYSNLSDYIVKAYNENEAGRKIRDQVRKTVHPEAEVVNVEIA